VSIIGHSGIDTTPIPQSIVNPQNVVDKELKQKQFAEELKRQIQERDQAKAQEKIRMRGKIPKYAQDDDEKPPSYFRSATEPQAQQEQARQPMMQETVYQPPQQQHMQGPPEDTFNQSSKNPGEGGPYSPQRTKADFPNIMTRGRVTHGRLDMALE